MQKYIVKLVVFLLQRTDISNESRIKLTKVVLDKLYALPLKEIISVNEQGVLLVNDKALDIETSVQLRESAHSALQSLALKTINSQVAFKAIALGVHKVEKPEQLLFSRAAIWWGQQQEALLKLLANEGTSPNLD